MAFRGIKCPDPDMPEEVPGHACYECALNRPERKCPYPSWLIAHVIPGFKDGEIEDWDETRESFSPTTLGGCKRQIALRRILDYTLDPASVWPMVRGTAFHLMAEHTHAPEHVEREIKLARRIDVDGVEVEVRGKADEYNSRTRHLVDIKTVSYLSDYLRSNAKPEWTAQLSVYKWLMAPDRPVETAEIQALDMKALDRRIYRLWSEEAVEEWIRPRARILLGVYRENLIPPILPQREQWRCASCPFREDCFEIGGYQK